MKNLIRGFTILLLAGALLSVACGPTQTLAYQQTDTVQHETYQDRAEADFSAAIDSLQFRYQNLQQEMTELKATFSESVPAAQAQMTIPTQSLIELPEGAKYGISDGRANVEAERKGDTIILTGRCDSLERKFSIYERTAFRQRNTIDSLNNVIHAQDSRLAQMALESASKASHTALATETRQPPDKKRTWLAAGAAIGIIGSACLQALWKRFKVGTIIKGFITKIR